MIPRHVWVALLGCVLGATGRAHSQPLTSSEFVRAAPQGFGDRQNSLPWSMIWWERENKLFVGTARAMVCTGVAVLELIQPRLPFYPPNDRDIECTPERKDLPLQAEIWSWSPETEAWDLVYRSPNDVEIPGHPGSFVAPDIGFREMQLFVEADGTEALYVSGVSAREFDEQSHRQYREDPQLPPPRILRSTDGQVFSPVPQEPGTFLHDLVPLNGFRGMTSLRGRLYVVASVGALGYGNLLESADPAVGNDSFRKIQVTANDYTPYEIETYNGYLYVGTGGQPAKGDPPVSVWKTDAAGEPPYTFSQVIPPGAFRDKREGPAAISMFVHNGRLFVGTSRELFRINPDDSWDLVVGVPRATPSGPLLPLSGLSDGFGNSLNIHMWRIGDHDGVLYVGTLDGSSKVRRVPGLGANEGFDLYATTTDGWYFTRVTRNGLAESPADRVFDHGVRSLYSTPYGLFVGAANPFYGLNIWRGTKASVAPDGPQRLELEVVNGVVILSWEGPAASRVYVLRDSTTTSTRQIRVPGTHVLGNTWAVVAGGSKGLPDASYQVQIEDALGQLSAPSNVAVAPSQEAGTTFLRLTSTLASWGAPDLLREHVESARELARSADYDGSRRGLGALLQILAPDVRFPAWRVEDAHVLVRKLIRRVTLVDMGLLAPEAIQE
jgi:hypothetical protein